VLEDVDPAELDALRVHGPDGDVGDRGRNLVHVVLVGVTGSAAEITVGNVVAIAATASFPMTTTRQCVASGTYAVGSVAVLCATR
jgi:hypothetical protein